MTILRKTVYLNLIFLFFLSCGPKIGTNKRSEEKTSNDHILSQKDVDALIASE